MGSAKWREWDLMILVLTGVVNGGMVAIFRQVRLWGCFRPYNLSIYGFGGVKPDSWMALPAAYIDESPIFAT